MIAIIEKFAVEDGQESAVKQRDICEYVVKAILRTA